MCLDIYQRNPTKRKQETKGTHCFCYSFCYELISLCFQKSTDQECPGIRATFHFEHQQFTQLNMNHSTLKCRIPLINKKLINDYLHVGNVTGKLPI